MERIKFIVIAVLVFFVMTISAASYLAIGVNRLYIPEQISNTSNLSCPTNKPVVSFEIDDITFTKAQSSMLQTALYLSNKYNITFELGVIADSFESEDFDNSTFGIYQENNKTFEVIAHGLTHYLDSSIDQSSGGVYGEFYVLRANQSVPLPIQENHIKRMAQIFQKWGIESGTLIFTTPYHSGDLNTVLLSDKYGYKLILQKITSPQAFSEIKFGKGIINSQVYIDIPTVNNFNSSDVLEYTYELNKAIQMGQSRIDVSLHPVNFEHPSKIDSFIDQLVNSNQQVSYKFLSDRFNC